MTRAGQIALIPHGTNLWQKLIELVTRAPVHHVIIAISETECVSAEIRGVRIRPIAHFPHAIWSNFDMTEPQRRDIVKFTNAQIGKKYALLDDLLIGIALLMKEHVPDWIVDRINDDGHWQCAELADASLLHGGISAVNAHVPPCVVFPGSFVPYFQAHGWWPKVYK